MRNAADVVQADLEYMHAALREEWPALAGRRLLITGGAGFLGYYFTHAAVHFNRSRTPGPSAIDDHRLRQSRPRRAGLARAAAGAQASSTLADPRHAASRCRAASARSTTSSTRASIASPTYYRAHPVETMDANINGLRNLLDYARAAAGQRDAGARPAVPLEQRDLRRPGARRDPDARRPIAASCRAPGPRACYDEAKRYGETLCAIFARQHGVPVRIARPFNNYGPGLKINDGRVLPDFARDVLDGRDIVMLSDGRRRGPSATSPTRSPATTRCWSAGTTGEPYNIGTETPEISMRELAERVVAAAAACSATREGRVQASPDARLSRRQPQPALPGHHQGARTIWATTRRSRSRTGWIARCLVPRSPGCGRSPGCRPPRRAREWPPDESLDHRHGLCRPGDRGLPRREGPPRRLRRYRDAKVAAISRGAAPFHEPASIRSWRGTSASRCSATADLRAAVLAPTSPCSRSARRSTAGDRPDLCPRGGAPDRRGLTRQAGLSRRGGQEHGRARHHRRRRACRSWRQASGTRRRARSRRRDEPGIPVRRLGGRDFMRPDRIVLGGIDARTQDVQAELYRDFDGTPVLRTSNATAEFIKYTSNSLLATLISFSNEIANLCATVPGVDAAEVMRGVHLMRELQPRCADGVRSAGGNRLVLCSRAAASAAAACPRTSRRWRRGARSMARARRCWTPCLPDQSGSAGAR